MVALRKITAIFSLGLLTGLQIYQSAKVFISAKKGVFFEGDASRSQHFSQDVRVHGKTSPIQKSLSTFINTTIVASSARVRRRSDDHQKASSIDMASRSSYDHPPCDISGAHFLFKGRYYHHRDSSDLLRAIQEGAYSEDDEIIMTGALYSVSGTEDFAKSAFLPVVEYLRTGLGIPNALDRQNYKSSSANNSGYARWALATEPHICNNVAVQQSALPFFDVLIIFTPDDLRKENSAKIWEPSSSDQSSSVLDKTTQTTALMNNNSRQVVGVGSTKERKNKKLFHHVKAIKVKALQSAPFPISVFIDVDMIPCRQDFTKLLLENAIESHTSPSFDIAITNSRENTGSALYEQTEKWHYKNINNGSPNQHNSACVVLNMTSANTIELLDRYRKRFFSFSRDPPDHDQPALGQAMYEMWMQNRLNHVDMSGKKVCRLRTGGIEGPQCPNNANKIECIVAHKIASFPVVRDA